jgi:putative transposase
LALLSSPDIAVISGHRRTLRKGSSRQSPCSGAPPHTVIIADPDGLEKAPGRMNQPSSSDVLALARHSAVSWIQEALQQHFTLARATALASERSWNGQTFSASTLESWYYTYKHEGFAGLQRQPRKDKGSRKALSAEAAQAIMELRQRYPQLTIKVLVRQLVEKGVLVAGTFSLASVYRLLIAHQLDARSIKRRPPASSAGPTKAFECALANELWMTDMMFGPTLKLASGKVIQTRLFALIDDCSRLVPHAQYYESEKLYWFLDCFRQALARRGFPEKLYTDQGKIFTSHHLRIVCANVGVRVCHAKPYAAWSKGKQERWFRTVQTDFEARLVIDPVHTLEELNARLWRWIESEYHQRPHTALNGQSPAARFAERALHIRTANAQTDWEALFLSRLERRVRLDATFSLEAQLWEAPTHLRGQLIEVRFNPFHWQRVEIWREGKFICLARRCDKQLNSKIDSRHDYDRPDRSR